MFPPRIYGLRSYYENNTSSGIIFSNVDAMFEITKATRKQMDLWTEQVTSQMNGQGKGQFKSIHICIAFRIIDHRAT